MARISDTSPEAEQFLRELLRKMPFERKWRQMSVLYNTGKVLHKAGRRWRNPKASDEAIHADWLAQAGIELVPPIWERPAILGEEEAALVVYHTVSVLESLHIRHALVGAWASSIHGKMRFTHDADICVEPFPGKEAAFCSALGQDYYVNEDTVRMSIRQHHPCKVIFKRTGFKVDLFIARPRLFDQSLLARSQTGLVPSSSSPPVSIVSPEDVVLLNLEGFRLGEKSSETHWNDILGVFEVQSPTLDQRYLDTWAEALGVTDLLQRARQESAPRGNA